MVNNKRQEKDPELNPIHPGEILREEFLIPMGIKSEELAKNIGVEEKIIKKILEEKHDIELSLSYRLGLYFDLRGDYWWNLQNRYELDCWKQREENKEIEKKILPQKIIFQAICWRLDRQTFKNSLDNAISTSHAK